MDTGIFYTLLHVGVLYSRGLGRYLIHSMSNLMTANYTIYEKKKEEEIQKGHCFRRQRVGIFHHFDRLTPPRRTDCVISFIYVLESNNNSLNLKN